MSFTLAPLRWAVQNSHPASALFALTRWAAPESDVKTSPLTSSELVDAFGQVGVVADQPRKQPGLLLAAGQLDLDGCRGDEQLQSRQSLLAGSKRSAPKASALSATTSVISRRVGGGRLSVVASPAGRLGVR